MFGRRGLSSTASSTGSPCCSTRMLSFRNTKKACLEIRRRIEKFMKLVLQGENDPRVPKEEAEQVVDSLKKDGKVVDAHYYSNEGHGFAKRENRIDAIRRSVDWFDKYLKNKQWQQRIFRHYARFLPPTTMRVHR